MRSSPRGSAIDWVTSSSSIRELLAEAVRMEVVLGHPLQPGSVDLAGRVERHLVEEDDLLRGLVADPVAAEDDQVGARGRLGALAQGHVGADVLAVDLVVNADGAGERQRRMLDQRA